MRLTDLTIKALKPGDKQYIAHDDALSGFGVRVSPHGTKAFVLTYGEDRKRITLGRYPLLSLSQARDRAKKKLAEKTLNPNEAPAITFKEARETFFKVHVDQHNRPSTRRTTKRLFDNLKNLDSKTLSDITPRDVTPILDRMLGRPSEANHTFVALRTFLRWCVGRGYLQYDPLAGLKKPAKAGSRERVLSEPELKSVLSTAPARDVYGQIILMLLYTGQRKGQIARLRADFIDRENKTITWPASLMKSNREHTIPYGNAVAAIIEACPEEGYLFRGRGDEPYNGWSNGKRYFDKHCKIAPWCPHDLRRVFSTYNAMLGTPSHIVERILAHQAGTISGVAAIYNRFEYMDEMRAAMARWEDHLAQLIRVS